MYVALLRHTYLVTVEWKQTTSTYTRLEIPICIMSNMIRSVAQYMSINKCFRRVCKIAKSDY
jgi:hypothetical protein